MERTEREIIERLGSRGLRKVLADLLDHNGLVRLANACGLRYPGMRTQSQRTDRILADLVDRAGREESVRKAIVRSLRKETAGAAKERSALSPEERARQAEDWSAAGRNGRTGERLFLLASETGDGSADAALSRILAEPEADAASGPAERPGGPPEPHPAAREAARLEKKAAQLQKKIAHLEGQIAKGREGEKALKRDLLRRKGELAEAQALNEQLRKEVQDLRSSAANGAAQAAAPAPIESALAEIAAGVRRLAAEQRRLAHRLDKLADAPPPRASVPPEALEPTLRAIEEMQKESSALRRERRKDHQDSAARMDELLAETRAVRAAVAAALPAPRGPARRKGEPERVGVFIDVQNMYYAARQLKGKLDFDALLQAAVRDRRLIRASAYVVETKEIDQSGFIAMLQQRAIEVRRKTLKVRSDGSMKGDWDMEMALDILDAAPKLDVVVLVSGDGDFTSLVSRVKAMGPRVEVIGFPRSTAKSLLEAADHFQPLDRKFTIRTEPPPPRTAGAAPVPGDAPPAEPRPEPDGPSR